MSTEQEINLAWPYYTVYRKIFEGEKFSELGGAEQGHEILSGRGMDGYV